MAAPATVMFHTSLRPRRFSSATFLLAGEASSPRLTPQGLTRFFETSQYGLLLESNAYRVTYPSDLVSLDDKHAWQEVCLEEADGDELLAKLGWALLRRGDGCWVTDTLSWHDFRPEFRPGIGEEEWDRSFG